MNQSHASNEEAGKLAYKYAVGIDIGGTHTKIGLVRSMVESPGLQMVQHCKIPSNLKGDDPSPFLQAACQVTEKYIEKHPVGGIGIALCSLINPEHTGASLSVNAPALNHLNIQRVFTDRFGCPVRIINDVNAYALAEYQFGAGRGVHRLLCLALGTGLAISAILEGNLIETWGGVPADAGRIILNPDSDARCAGGVKGSAEALLGTAAIRRLASQKYQHSVTARQVISASAAGIDPIAGEVMAEIGARAGHLLALLSPIFFPQRILVTGGTAQSGKPFFQALNDRYQNLIGEYMQRLNALENDPSHPVEIVKGELGPEASILGAAHHFI